MYICQGTRVCTGGQLWKPLVIDIRVTKGVALADAEYHARVVSGLLAESVTVGEIEDVRAQLPADFAHLFEVENEGEIPELGTVTDVEEENA